MKIKEVIAKISHETSDIQRQAGLISHYSLTLLPLFLLSKLSKDEIRPVTSDISFII